jgi:signal peptidase I
VIARGVRDSLLVAGAAILGALLVKTYVFDAVHVPTASMSRTLLPGDFVLVNKLAVGPAVFPHVEVFGLSAPALRFPAVSPPRPGDVVLFRFPGTSPGDAPLHYVKRLIGKGGDVVEIRGNRVVVNGTPLRSIPTAQDPGRALPEFGPYTVPRGMFFVLGDNLADSYDSRAWGCVPAGDLLGKALLIYWSKGEEGIRWDRLGTFIR